MKAIALHVGQILIIFAAFPIAAVSWLFMARSKEPERSAKWHYGWGLWDPRMKPHWDRLWGAIGDLGWYFDWFGIVGLGKWVHAISEAMKNLGSEWARLDAMRAFKVMALITCIATIV